ncbi:hypothetical protein [Kitasatospora cheerisanensis]|uniref:Uncharacterized protein n=1 Tax=Kitasatospora cheerisanensis KCTC 2395 TaxID=1348663 RepID=A0A066YTK0_9ACTN|nr:hypothetical protein [Kitasatospora cheerisanensis]KDN84567.1 hypothetical protein KCH_36590 [Kitasatospora cheerisanensis KCTC 2395]
MPRSELAVTLDELSGHLFAARALDSELRDLVDAGRRTGRE